MGLTEKTPPPELVAMLPSMLVELRRAVVRQPAADWVAREARAFKWGRGEDVRVSEVLRV